MKHIHLIIGLIGAMCITFGIFIGKSQKIICEREPEYLHYVVQTHNYQGYTNFSIHLVDSKCNKWENTPHRGITSERDATEKAVELNEQLFIGTLKTNN